MSYLTFVSELVQSLAWPIAAIIIAMVFKKPLENLINRVKEFEIGKLKAKLSEVTLHEAAQRELAEVTRQKQLESAEDKTAAKNEQAAQWTSTIRGVLTEAVKVGASSNPTYAIGEEERQFAKKAVEEGSLRWNQARDGVMLS